MLHVLAQTHTAGVRTHGNAELRRHQHYREHFVHAAEATAVDLTKSNRLRLHQLLEDHAILALLAGRDADRRDGFGDPRVAQHVVGARRLLDPPWIEPRELAHVLDCLVDVPHLIRVEHQLALLADRLAHDLQATLVVLQVATDLDLEVRPPLLDTLTTQLADLLVGVAEPAGGRRVRGIAVGEHFFLALRARVLELVQNVDCLFRPERVSDVVEVDRAYDLLGRHVDDELPGGFALDLRPDIPARVHDPGGGEVYDALLRPHPAELRITREHAPDGTHVALDRLQR